MQCFIIFQFKFNRERPDLTKIDNLIGLLSTGSTVSFDNNIEPLQEEFEQKGIVSVLTRLLMASDQTPDRMDTSTSAN
jgi:hypothetical protein